MIFEMIAKHNNNSSRNSNNNNSVAAAPGTKDERRTGTPEVHPRASARSLENQCAMAGLAMVTCRRWCWYGVQYVHAGGVRAFGLVCPFASPLVGWCVLLGAFYVVT
jgi:hypothetical protein